MDPNAQKSAPASSERKQSGSRPPRFDTMKAVGNLKEAEFREQQAVVIVETIRDSQIEFATRDDLYTVRDDLYTVRDDLHVKLENLELVLRNEIDSLRSEMRSEIGSLRSEMHSMIDSLRNEMRSEMRAEMQEQLAAMQWRLLIGMGIIVGIFGTIVTVAVTLAGGK